MQPLVSIVVPALNAESVIESCLKSIEIQDYPPAKIEVIVADGGSNDATIGIAQRYQAKVVGNPLKTSESGKMAALREAKGELIAFIDSDNILPDPTWLKTMVEPFKDHEIVATEPIEYTYRKQDPWLTRYFALLGMNDPLCLFLGNYDRISALTGKWTNLNFRTEDHDSYLKVKLDHEPIPTIGANGTLVRMDVLKNIKGDYLFDIDVLLSLMRKKGVLYIAKVKTGIVHTFVEDSPTKFFRKQLRRINDLSFHQTQQHRETNWERAFLLKIIWFQVQCLLVFPILYQTIKGYFKVPDSAWLFHPIACYSTWFIYLYGWIRGKIRPQESSRINWKQ